MYTRLLMLEDARNEKDHYLKQSGRMHISAGKAKCKECSGDYEERVNSEDLH